MYLSFKTNRAVCFEDRHNFRAFKVVIEGSPDIFEQAQKAFEGLAELPKPDTAWVFMDVLRRRPEVVQDEMWQALFDSMIEKAKVYGWVDEGRKLVKAHIEWVDMKTKGSETLA